MQDYRYQRAVVAYHGCDASTAEKVLHGGDNLLVSEKAYDWLGKGIYFWEHGPERAMDWAKEHIATGRIRKPAVVGAIINLGNCFDLLDMRYTEILRRSWPEFLTAMNQAGNSIPKNISPRNDPHKERLLHYRDCAVINWTIPSLESEGNTTYDSVRGVFLEDDPVYEGSAIHLKSHIQIAIRNPTCIVGYFLPNSNYS